MRPTLLLAFLTLPLAAEPGGIFLKGSRGSTVSEGHQFAEGMIVDRENNLYFTDVPRSQLFRIDGKTRKRTLLDSMTGRTNGIAQGIDRRIYGCASGDKKIYAWSPESWKKTAVAQGPSSNDIAIRKDGTIFFTDEEALSVKDRREPGGMLLPTEDDVIDLMKMNYVGRTTVFSAISDGGACGEDARGYREVTYATDGLTVDLCEQNATIQNWFREYVSRLSAEASPYVLSERPIPGSIRVFVKGQEVVHGRENGFIYDAASNAISFFGTARPELADLANNVPGDGVTVIYERR